RGPGTPPRPRGENARPIANERSLLVFHEPHRRLLARPDQESVVVLHRLFELEAASSELVELVRSLAEPCRRLSERGRAIHRPLRAHGAVPPVTPLVPPVLHPALVDRPPARRIHAGSYTSR